MNHNVVINCLPHSVSPVRAEEGVSSPAITEVAASVVPVTTPLLSLDFVTHSISCSEYIFDFLPL